MKRIICLFILFNFYSAHSSEKDSIKNRSFKCKLIAYASNIQDESSEYFPQSLEEYIQKDFEIVSYHKVDDSVNHNDYTLSLDLPSPLLKTNYCMDENRTLNPCLTPNRYKINYANVYKGYLKVRITSTVNNPVEYYLRTTYFNEVYTGWPADGILAAADVRQLNPSSISVTNMSMALLGPYLDGSGFPYKNPIALAKYTLTCSPKNIL